MNITLTEHIIPVEISGIRFQMDGDNIELHQAISDFIDNYRGNRVLSDEFVKDCKETIDILLGKGAYQKLFVKDDLKPYYVILQLAEALSECIKDASTTEQMKKRKETAEKELKAVQGILEGAEKFGKQMAYAERKYGKNHVASKRGFTKNRKGKR